MNLVMDMERMANKTPPVSVKDCTVVGRTDRGLNRTDRVGGCWMDAAFGFSVSSP